MKSFLGGGNVNMIISLHRGDTAKLLQYYMGGGSLGTPKNDYVICARPLMDGVKYYLADFFRSKGGRGSPTPNPTNLFHQIYLPPLCLDKNIIRHLSYPDITYRASSLNHSVVTTPAVPAHRAPC